MKIISDLIVIKVAELLSADFSNHTWQQDCNRKREMDYGEST